MLEKSPAARKLYTYYYVSIDECDAILKELDAMPPPDDKVWVKYTDPKDGSFWWWCEKTKECKFTEPIVRLEICS